MTMLFATSIVRSLIAWCLHGATLLDGRHVGGGHALGLDALVYLTYPLPPQSSSGSLSSCRP
jgi:hypothetical protein